MNHDSQDRDSVLNRLASLPSDLRLILEKRLELLGLQMADRIAGIIAWSVFFMAGVVLVSLAVVLLLFAASRLVGELLDSQWLGYLVIGLPVFLFGFLFLSGRPRWLVRALRNRMFVRFVHDTFPGASQQGNSTESQQGNQSPASSSNEKPGGVR